jgi:hypothetical protein
MANRILQTRNVIGDGRRTYCIGLYYRQSPAFGQRRHDSEPGLAEEVALGLLRDAARQTYSSFQTEPAYLCHQAIARDSSPGNVYAKVWPTTEQIWHYLHQMMKLLVRNQPGHDGN